MQFYTQKIVAGVPYQFPVAGRVFLLDAIGTGSSVDVTLLDMGSSPRQIMPNRKVGFKCVTDFSGVVLTSAVDNIISFFVSMDNVDIGFADGAAVAIPGGVKVINDDAEPVPVKTPAGEPLEVLFAGTVDPVLGDVTVTNTDAQAVPVVQKVGTSFAVEQAAGASFEVKAYQAAAAANGAPVAMTDVIAAIIAADATRRGLRLRNVGANPVALVAAAGTYANAAVILQTGETWNENEAPGAAWYGICDAGLASTINIQTIS